MIKRLNESYDYNIYRVSMDVAVRSNDTIDNYGYNESLFRDFVAVLNKHGYEMAGDYIDIEDMGSTYTDQYKDNEYEFFED